MTRIFVLLSFFYAVSASGGFLYHVRIVTSGPTGSTIAGTARVDGANFRIDFDRGDGLLIRQGMFMIGKSGQETVTLANSTNRSYSELELGELAGGLTSMLRQFGVTFAIENPRVRSRLLGDGGVIEGFPTRRSTVNANFDVRLNLIGAKTLNHVQMRTESWSTNRIPGTAASFLPFQGTRTGIPEIDKLLAAQTAAVQGFPLRQITRVRVVTNGRESTTTSTADVSRVVERKFSAADFAIPDGFKKVESSLGQLFAK